MSRRQRSTSVPVSGHGVKCSGSGHGPPRRMEADGRRSAQHHDDRVGDLAAAVKLHRYVKVRLPGRIQERRPRMGIRLALRQAAIAGKLDERVNEMTEPADELRRPRQPDQRDDGGRIRVAQRAKRGHRAQQVAQLQRAKHGNALRTAVPQVEPRHQNRPR